MSVSIWVGDDGYEIGTPSFLNSFFSTIFVRLENERWGSRFPVIMRELYSGFLNHEKAKGAIDELESIRKMLAVIAPDQVVWDHGDRSASPPWGANISPAITSLANYFVTSRGENIFQVLLKAFEEADVKKRNIRIA
jgi:hypothetical protein